jgi:phosphate transport system protein
MEITNLKLKEMILKMAISVEEIIESSYKKDISLQQIFVLENEVNTFHKDIDDHIFKYIALKNPIATDLRTAIAIMKINSELERIADQAVNIKRALQKLSKTYSQLDTMFNEVQVMYKKSIDAFINLDVKNSTKIIHHDQEINELYKEIMRIFIRKMKEDKIDFDEGFLIIKSAKCLERIGDQITNIAEDIIFLETGADIRHNSDIKFGKKN